MRGLAHAGHSGTRHLGGPGISHAGFWIRVRSFHSHPGMTKRLIILSYGSLFDSRPSAVFRFYVCAGFFLCNLFLSFFSVCFLCLCLYFFCYLIIYFLIARFGAPGSTSRRI